MPAVHCAGAVEELCGRYLEARGGKTQLDNAWDQIDYSDVVLSKKEYVMYANELRDWIKHTNALHPEVLEFED